MLALTVLSDKHEQDTAESVCYFVSYCLPLFSLYKQFCDFVLEPLCDFAWISSTMSVLWLFDFSFILRNKAKSQGVWSSEYDGHVVFAMQLAKLSRVRVLCYPTIDNFVDFLLFLLLLVPQIVLYYFIMPLLLTDYLALIFSLFLYSVSVDVVFLCFLFCPRMRQVLLCIHISSASIFLSIFLFDVRNSTPASHVDYTSYDT